MAKLEKITEFSFTNGQITGHSKPNGDGQFNFWNYECHSKQGQKIGYGSLHTDILEALKVQEKVEKGSLIRITVEVFQKPEAASLAAGKNNEF